MILLISREVFWSGWTWRQLASLERPPSHVWGPVGNGWACSRVLVLTATEGFLVGAGNGKPRSEGLFSLLLALCLLKSHWQVTWLPKIQRMDK